MDASREELLFDLALNQPDAGRAAWLTLECKGDTALRRRVEALLAAHEQPSGLLPNDPCTEISAVRIGDMKRTEGPEWVISRYKLLEKLGEGGFGAVWAAEQREPVKRRVALKIIKLGMDTKQVVARFEAERQALALMDHPNIAKVLDAGSTDTGRPYFVMELVKGIKITDYCNQERLGTNDRLDLFIQVCHAIQHAHQKGIIHRDIKPSNILVTLHDGVPVPKVIDFGIAKATQQELTELTIYTQHHQFIGTPAYMSPEQAEMSGLDIDTRSDIYSLGVLLYELLTGATPFDTKELMQSGLDEMRKIIREREPVRPSTRLRQTRTDSTVTSPRLTTHSSLPTDLDWIVMKCLEKDRTRRYETANGLATDLKRHLNNEPVVARPPSVAYQVQKAWRRNRLVFAAGTAVAAALLAGIGISTWQMFQARKAQREAEVARNSELQQRLEAETQRRAAEASAEGERRQRSRVEALAYSTDMNLVLSALEMNNLGRGQELLNRNRPVEGEPDRRGWEWRHLWKRSRSDELATLGSHDHAITALKFSPLGDLLASGAFDGKVKLWNWRNRFPVGEIDPGSEVEALDFSPDGRWLAMRSRGRGCQVWDVSVKREIARIQGSAEERGTAVAFSPTGDLLALNTDGSIIEIWNPHTRTRVAALRGHELLIRALIFSPDGNTLYSAGEDRTVRVWDLAARREAASLRGHTRWITSLALSPEGSLLASSSGDGTICIWDLKLRRESVRLTHHRSLVWDVQFSPDGRLLASSGADQRIRLWDTATWRETRVLKGHLNEIWRVAFSPDGRTLASGGKDESVKVWSVESRPEPPAERTFPPGTPELSGTLSPDGRWFSYFVEDRLVLGDTRSLRDVKEVVFDGRQTSGVKPTACLIDSTGQQLYLGYADGRIQEAMGINTERDVTVLAGHEGGVVALALSPDGQHLASAAGDRTLHVQQVRTGKPVVTLSTLDHNMNGLRFSPDGFFLAGSTTKDEIFIWDLRTGTHRLRLAGHKGRISGMDFSPDGRRLASASWDGTAGLWDLATGRRLASLRAHLLGVNTVAFSPDGRRLAAGTGDGFIKLWNVTDGHEVLTLTGHRDINQVAFLPGDETLVSVTPNSIQLWSAPPLSEINEMERRAQ